MERLFEGLLFKTLRSSHLVGFLGYLSNEWVHEGTDGHHLGRKKWTSVGGLAGELVADAPGP